MNTDFIYKVKINNKKILYYLDCEDVQQYLNNSYNKVYYIKVSTDEPAYIKAISNSINNNKQKIR
jgi:uncharacterized protein YcgL (UPF0745 family)